MRIFHFMNIPLNIEHLIGDSNSITTAGGWLAVLLRHLHQETDFQFACAAFGAVGETQHFYNDRIDCFVIPRKHGPLSGSVDHSLKSCQLLVEQWKPNLIHIHGTEQVYGLLSARRMIKLPTVISLQGLLGPYSEWYNYFGNASLIDILHMHRWLEIPAGRGQLIGFLKFKKQAVRELEIIKGNKFFMGRTEWDKAYIRAINPSAGYYHCGELLRSAFTQKRWELSRSHRHRIIFTNAGHPRKGTETLLNAVKILQPHFPDIQVCIAGGISSRSGYGKYIRHKITCLGNAGIELGQLNADQMAEELIKSHVFVSPSFIDNSPNAVCEAHMVGIPVISTYTGGVPSLIDDGLTGLFFPCGDAPMLAERIRQIFENDDLAIQLGARAHKVAIKRHHSEQVISEIVAAYEDVIRNSQ